MYIKCWFGSLTDFILFILIFLPFGGMCIFISFIQAIYRVCLGRVTAYKPNYAFRAFRPHASNVYDNRKRTSSYAFI